MSTNLTIQQLLRIVFSFLPFAVCMFWTICYVIQYRKNDAPKHFLTIYLIACVVLYLCHALFFTIGLSYEMECLWTLCSLSVYPLFYGYLCRLTSSDYSAKQLLPWLVPGAMVTLAKYIYPEAGIDKVRLLLFACQTVLVCFLGIRKLRTFDKKLHSVYADTDGRDTTAVMHLLIAIIIVSILAGIANYIGKQFFGESLWLLIPISMAFSVMLFSLSYICFYRDFTIDQLNIDEDIEQTKEPPVHEDNEITSKMEKLMIEQHYFLKKDLRIGDIVKAIGSNRTYVSNYINKTYKCSFSDYVNRLRIEYAQKLILSSRGTKLTQIAEDSGFASEQSFYRNFKKFVGMTPSDWLSKVGKDNPATTVLDS